MRADGNIDSNDNIFFNKINDVIVNKNKGKQDPATGTEGTEKKVTSQTDKLKKLETSTPSKLVTQIKTVAEQIKNVMAIKGLYNRLEKPGEKYRFLMDALAGNENQKNAALSILIDEENKSFGKGEDPNQFKAEQRLKNLCDESEGGLKFDDLIPKLAKIRGYHEILAKMDVLERPVPFDKGDIAKK